WETVFNQLGHNTRQFFLRFLVWNRIFIPESRHLKFPVRELGEAVSTARLDRKRQPLQMGDSLRKLLRKVQDFSLSLIKGKPDTPFDRPIDLEEQVAEAISHVAGLTSPLAAVKTQSAFRNLLVQEMRSIAEQLLYATVIPRPDMADQMLKFSRRNMVMTGGRQLPVTEFTLPFLLACYNLLCREIHHKTVSLEAWEARISKSNLRSGDMFLIEKSLDGLIRIFRHRLGKPELRWEQLPVKDDSWSVLAKAVAQCPPVWLTDGFWRGICEQRQIPLTHLERFLDEEGGELLRKLTVDRWIRRTLKDRDAIPGGVAFALERCLDTGTVFGTVIVAEYVHAIVAQIFGDCERGATHLDPQLESQTEADLRKEAYQARRTFYEWFASREDFASAAWYRILVKLFFSWKQLEAKHASGWNQPNESIAWWRLNRFWLSTVKMMTRGFQERRWHRKAQPLLKLFWLNFCIEIFEQGHDLPERLSHGAGEWDNLSKMACKIVAHFVRQIRHTKRNQQQTQLDGFLEFESDKPKRVEEVSIGSLQKLVDQTTEQKDFRMLLIVNQLLTLDNKWDEKRLAEWDAAF
ncbi:MAG: hypothetical protein KDA84_21220, partial [Planctomycetaceae bacterium]|nr:hypothetical protein [Planctomycetaceae bacterium]